MLGPPFTVKRQELDRVVDGIKAVLEKVLNGAGS
jgi:adenosylmethionine-8-amino-7-oxononanoate aminotransferase